MTKSIQYDLLEIKFFSVVMKKKFGSMLKAQRRPVKNGIVLADDARPMISAESTGL
ncbi:MAG TPA: hypothetical protein P5120_16935 [Spirochaetota bacterium]|nr:hypothetical protein [Spirochaetota bacterium]HRX49208.1 hypothetical protein [Spirochaetota bacterium]